MDRSTRGNFIIYDHINISFAVQMHPDNSCSQIDSEAYLTMMYQEIFRELKPNDIICRVADCIRARLLACYPICLPCQNATEEEKNSTIDAIWSAIWFPSSFDERMSWSYQVQTNSYTERILINTWKVDQIFKFFNSTRLDCEDQVLHPQIQPGIKPAFNLLYSLLIIPVGIVSGTIFVVCKLKQPNREGYAPIASAANV